MTNWICNPYKHPNNEKDSPLINLDRFDKIVKGSIIDLDCIYTILFLKDGNSQATAVWEFDTEEKRNEVYSALEIRFTEE